MYILGIWDGHDAGACIVEDGEIKAAINEERLTRKKSDIVFPQNSIKACLEYLDLKPADIETVAMAGTQLSRLMARQIHFIDERYYKIRRRLVQKPKLERFQKLYIKYLLARYNFPILRGFAERQTKNKLRKMGFEKIKIHAVDHHMSHAASTIFTSGFKKNLCITLDGVGDGLSGTISTFENGEIKKISEMKEKDSIGIFFELVTNILGFRELEDEGKVMAMADYSYPIPDEKNKLINFFEVDGLRIKAKHGTSKRFSELEKIKWNTPIERFAYMAQRTLEKHTLQLFRNAIDRTGVKDVCWSGGVASNIKLNRILRLDSGLKDWFVFPHMGDGGLAVGAALFVAHELQGITPKRIDNSYFGLDYDDKKIEEALRSFSSKVEYEQVKDPSHVASDLINKNNYIFWFQGRMEYGPRALGNRSILASADSDDAKEVLNLMVKKREWFQPFCPSLLEEDAKEVFEDYDGKPDRFMTMGYMLRKQLKKKFASISNVDGSVRPQMVGQENEKYRKLLEGIKKRTGFGIVLNTSFNIHGEPIVCSPKDALNTMMATKTKHMVLGNFLTELK
jgi:carbamoyltransferase